MTRDDVMRETVAHVRRVGNLLLEIIARLQTRAVNHDDSKFSAEEFESFAQETPGLRSLTYGSDEYKAALSRIKPALEKHYERNDHHPEHFDSGIRGMGLIELVEMLADWKAATERHADGDLLQSIEKNAERFGYGDELKRILGLTALSLGWIKNS